MPFEVRQMPSIKTLVEPVRGDDDDTGTVDEVSFHLARQHGGGVSFMRIRRTSIGGDATL
jgi:hypothetical protein